jgi:hypothetical protein
MTSSNSIRTGLAVTRMAVGALSWVAPRTSARAFGIDPDRSNGVVARLFGARDLLLGTALLVADDEQLVPAAQLGAAADMLDVLATGIEYRGGRASNWTLVSVGAGAATFAALGVLLIRNAEGA